MSNGELDDDWYYRKLQERYPEGICITADLIRDLQQTGKIKIIAFRHLTEEQGYTLKMSARLPNHFSSYLAEGRIFHPDHPPYYLEYRSPRGEETIFWADKICEGGVIIRRLHPHKYKDWEVGEGLAEYISLRDFYEFEDQRKQNEKEDGRKVAEARQAAQELERQNKIGSYPLMIHVDAFLKRLDELPAEEVKGDREQKLVALYFKLKQVLESNGQLSLEERELLGDHYRQSAEFDAVLKLWNDKIAKAKADTTLDEQQRKLTVGHLMAMMNKALQRLQED